MTDFAILEKALEILAKEKAEREDLAKWQKELPAIFEEFINELLEGKETVNNFSLGVKKNVPVRVKGDLGSIKNMLSLAEFLSVFPNSFSLVYLAQCFSYLNKLGFSNEQILLSVYPVDEVVDVHIILSPSGEMKDGSCASILRNRLDDIITRKKEFDNLLGELEGKVLDNLRNGESVVWLWHGHKRDVAAENLPLQQKFYLASFSDKLCRYLKSQGLDGCIVWDNGAIGVDLAALREKYEADFNTRVSEETKEYKYKSVDDVERDREAEFRLWLDMTIEDPIYRV